MWNWPLANAARLTILENLAAETLPGEEDVCSTQEPWEHCSKLVEFKDALFPQFEKQLKEHWTRADKKWARAMKEWAALQQDRAKHNEATTCNNGRRAFVTTPATVISAPSPSALKLRLPRLANDFRDWVSTPLSFLVQANVKSCLLREPAVQQGGIMPLAPVSTLRKVASVFFTWQTFPCSFSDT